MYNAFYLFPYVQSLQLAGALSYLLVEFASACTVFLFCLALIAAFISGSTLTYLKVSNENACQNSQYYRMNISFKLSSL